jgi:hypothetical protein
MEAAMLRPTPWLGLWGRIDIGVFLLWVAALAVALRKMQVARPAATAVEW